MSFQKKRASPLFIAQKQEKDPPMTKQLSPEKFAELYDLDVAPVTVAFQKLASLEVIALGVSGRFGAGKDSVAPKVIKDLGFGFAAHESFASALKDEVDEFIKLILTHETPEEVASAAEVELNVPYAQGKMVAERIWDEVKSGQVTNSRVRTDNTRFALQQWGTEIRRSQDTNYWVKKAMTSIVTKLAKGISVFATDARFENELDALHALGATTVRLVVSREEQDRRILERDGILPTEDARNHISETSLDEYERQGNFDVIVDTDPLSREAVIASVVSEIKKLKSANK